MNFTTKMVGFQVADVIPLQLPKMGEQHFHHLTFQKAENIAETTVFFQKNYEP